MCRLFKILLACLFLSTAVFAQNTSDVDVLPDFEDDSRAVLNDVLRRTNRRVMLLENGIPLTTGVTGILPMANGGTASALTDPGADRIGFWDDSAGVFTWLTAGSGLTITGTTITGSNIPSNIQVFIANGTWTKPAGISKVYVKVWGAGGDGHAGSATYAGGGGGGGGFSEGLIAVTGNVTVTIGTASGATSSFAGTTTIQATGGATGASTTGASAAGGVGSGGTLNLYGGAGGQGGIPSGNGVLNGGNGGNSPMGGQGGCGGFPEETGSVDDGELGTVPGGGGGGGGTDNSPSVGGGHADGMVVVYY